MVVGERKSKKNQSKEKQKTTKKKVRIVLGHEKTTILAARGVGGSKTTYAESTG